jgi:hypothetical protein
VFHLVSYKWFRRTRNITELGLDYKEVWRGFGRYEYLTWWYFWWVFVLEGGLWSYHFSIHIIILDSSVFVVTFPIPKSSIYRFSFTFFPIRVNHCSLTIRLVILVFTNILTSIRIIVCSLTILFPHIKSPHKS